MSWENPPQARSLVCNGEAIRFFRNQRSITQQELADAAGYSKRVIAKAESGGSLSPDTIEVLALTLSDADHQVFPEDLTSSPREMATALLRAITTYEEKAVSHLRHLLADDVQVFFPGGDSCAPLSGIHVGIDAYDTMTQTFFEIFQRPDKTLAMKSAIVTTDGNRALLACFEKLGNEYIPADSPATPLVLMMVISRGKMAAIQYIFDTIPFCHVMTAWREKQKKTVSHDDVLGIHPAWRNGEGHVDP